MFVYVWKHNDTPFYVGMTKHLGRVNPLNSGHKVWLCRQKLDQIGRGNVVVEVHTVDTIEAAKEMEISLIEKYGRINLGTGPLTNLRKGGEGSGGMSAAGKASLSARMKANNPSANPDVRAKLIARMRAPDVREKFAGANNPSKRPEVREKLKAIWRNPEFRTRQKIARTGRKKHSEAHKQKLRESLLNPDNPMRKQHKVLNSDPAIAVKRVSSLRSTERRKKASMTSKTLWALRDPEARTKQLSGIGKPHSEETRAKQAASARRRWEERRKEKSTI